MSFKYNKFKAQCFWCKRTTNPHHSYMHETIPIKTLKTPKGRYLELCFSCYENEKNKAKLSKVNFKKSLDEKIETIKILGFNFNKK